jgi:Domain of unknown function (DUF1707)/Cell wall-active antibiotics response 4TMS YvqF
MRGRLARDRRVVVRYLQGVNSRPGPHDLRASDADRELVMSLLTEAAADGRLTMPEHAERAERALTARTLGELAKLTSDLTLPSGAPIRLYPRRAVTALFARERREGRWVVPEAFPVTAFFGNVVLDLREAILQSPRVTIYATAIGGQVRLIVPSGVAVEMVGRSFFGVRSVRGRSMSAAQAKPGAGVIEVRTLAVGGSVKAITVRPSRWRSLLRRR